MGESCLIALTFDYSLFLLVRFLAFLFEIRWEPGKLTCESQ